MTEIVSSEIQLVSRPQGMPTSDNFAIAETKLEPLQDGQVLVRNLYISVDPYMRGRMNDVKSYSAPFALDAAMEGGAVGEVIASRSADRAVGDTVVHSLGWREYAVLDAAATTPARTDLAPASAFLGALGMTGLTAYAGLLKVAEFKPGEAVFVSGAAGAVGSLVGQIAKAMGASRVIGSAGSPAKVARLLELGFDAAFDYHGGEHLEAALAVLNVGGRVAMCGLIADYTTTEPTPAPHNLMQAIGKQ